MDHELVSVPRRLLRTVLVVYAALAGGTTYAVLGLLPASSPLLRWTAAFVMAAIFMIPAYSLWLTSRGHRPPRVGRVGLALMQGSVVVAFLAWVWMVTTR